MGHGISNRPTQQQDLQIFRFDSKGKCISFDGWIDSIYAIGTWEGLVIPRLGVHGRVQNVEVACRAKNEVS